MPGIDGSGAGARFGGPGVGWGAFAARRGSLRVAIWLAMMAVPFVFVSPSFGASSSFTYDKLNRLASATIDGSRIEYTYDAAGNITRVVTPYAIRVTKDGDGTGVVSDDRGKIDCGGDCSGVYDLNTPATLTARPDSGMVFSGWSGLCTGTDPCAVTVTVMHAVTATFTARVNTPPTLSIGISDQSADEDAAFSFTFASDTFEDADAGDSLTYAATLADDSPLPAWLSFDPETREFSGTPLNGDVGSIDVKVTATDTAGASISDTFTITVANTNDAPTVANAIADQPATEDSPFSFAFASNTFADDDIIHGDSLSYAATQADGSPLPSWLSFTAGTRTFGGTPLNADVGLIDVKVTATDTAAASASDTLTITVANTNDPPAIADQGFSVEEGSPNGTVVDTVTASDEDVGDTLSFAITAGNASGAFAIDGASGEITVADSTKLDHASTPSFSLTVEVTDDGTPPLSASATITIDVNEVGGVPVLVSLSPSSVCEGSDGFTLTVTGSATDPAFTDTSTVRWDGSDLSTTFVDATTLHADVDSSSVATEGTATVTVSSGGDPSNGLTFTIDADTTDPVVVAPAPITVAQTGYDGEVPGATAADSPELATFLDGGTATDDCSSTAVWLPPQVDSVDTDPTTFFPAGVTTVTFRFQDNAGNVGEMTSSVTVHRFGSADGDAVIDSVDMVIFGNYLVGNLVPGEPPFLGDLSMLDLNSDGKVDTVDLVILANYLVGNIDHLPIN